MIQEKFYNLEGSWSIKRNIVDMAYGNGGYGEGKASFIHSNNDRNTLLYKEILSLNLVQERGCATAHQEYRFVYDGKDGFVSKYTSSGDLMYKLDMGEQNATGIYLCGSDQYIAIYNFIDNNKFTLTYKVSGDRKNYTAITEFEKIDEGAPESLEIGSVNACDLEYH
jgi:hypothetical protein